MSVIYHLDLLCTELEIQKLWRSVAVDGMDERNIEEYLQRHNIVTMQDRVMKKVRNVISCSIFNT